MAESEQISFSMSSAQESIPTCDVHHIFLCMFCEDCDEYICSRCAKSDHKEHNWEILSTTARQMKSKLSTILKCIKDEKLPEINEEIKNKSEQIKENEGQCKSELVKMKGHCDAVMTKLKGLRNCLQNQLKSNLEETFEKAKRGKENLETRKEELVEKVNFLEKNINMSDYSLIDTYKELTKLSVMKIENCEFSMRFRQGEINDGLLKAICGEILDLENISVTESNSFLYEQKKGHSIILDALSNDECYLGVHESDDFYKVNKLGERKDKFKMHCFDLCVTEDKDVYFTDDMLKAIRCLSPSGSFSTVAQTKPLLPKAICQSVAGGLLLTLRDDATHDPFYLGSRSRRLVRYTTLTGDLIREYEFKEDGRTRLFTGPIRIKQNKNFDICVVNLKDRVSGELVILSVAGDLKSVYTGQNLKHSFYPGDVDCDPDGYLLVTDTLNHMIHLLNPEGEFLKFILTENEVKVPHSLSFHEPTLWVGECDGRVKVFQYKNTC